MNAAKCLDAAHPSSIRGALGAGGWITLPEFVQWHADKIAMFVVFN